ncbi:MAG: hypothetical protein IKW30_06125 [Lachnospiraceae bacterium]|nr:hypothetical protein [Lachnospiraceae bacterium]
MELTTLHYMGIIIFILDFIWISIYYYYGTVKIYNYNEGDKYHYLGFLWIRKKRGEWFITIPQDMIDNSITTKYKIVSASGFHALRNGQTLFISFNNNYEVKVKISKEFYASNYFCTSNQF